MNQKRLIFDLSLDELGALAKAWGQASYRADQIWQGLYQSLWAQSEDFSPLPQSLRERLAEDFTFSHLTAVRERQSGDGKTHKTLFHLPDGHAIETVWMSYRRRETLCISSQSGCAIGCPFCATGQMGLRRDLSSGEIVEQVVHYARKITAKGERITNVVVMGMGEPFLNYDATLEAIRRLNHPEGMNLGARRFTISTVGIVPGIRRLAEEDLQVNLAISLHAADDALRSTLIPINRKYPIDAILAAVRDYIRATNRRVTFEWALIANLNDTVEQAQQLASLLEGMLAHVNLIPLNPTQGYQGEAAPRDRAERFQSILEERGIPSTIRLRRGVDIQAGCGQLAQDDKKLT
jgi:23S rRNA (adenine2503-C2)-methyltransferase